MYPLQLVPKPHTHSSVSSPSQSTRGTGTAQGVKASPPHTDRVGSCMSPLPIGSLGRPPRGPTSSNQQLPGPLYRWVPPPPQQAKVNRRCLRRKGRVLLTPDQTQAWGLSVPSPGLRPTCRRALRSGPQSGGSSHYFRQTQMEQFLTIKSETLESSWPERRGPAKAPAGDAGMSRRVKARPGRGRPRGGRLRPRP